MISDAVKIAKLRARQHDADMVAKLAIKLVTNPIIELAALCVLLNYTDKHTNFSQLGQDVIFAAGSGAIIVQQLAQSPELVNALAEGGKALPGAIVTALALGA